MARTFSETMSALRKSRRLTQRQAASDLNISQALLSHYENGAREPGLDFICRACGYYGVSADYLLGISEIPGGAEKAIAALCELTDGLDALRARGGALTEEMKR